MSSDKRKATLQSPVRSFNTQIAMCRLERGVHSNGWGVTSVSHRRNRTSLKLEESTFCSVGRAEALNWTVGRSFQSRILVSFTHQHCSSPVIGFGLKGETAAKALEGKMTGLLLTGFLHRQWQRCYSPNYLASHAPVNFFVHGVILTLSVLHAVLNNDYFRMNTLDQLFSKLFGCRTSHILRSYCGSKLFI